MESKLLKPYKGFDIEKSYEINADGTIRKDTIVYAAYTSDGNLYDCLTTLSALKKEIDIYVQ